MPKLLVVDDEPSVLALFKAAFGKAGIEVLTAGSAAEAVRQIARERPDVGVFDVMLPDRSGLELLDDVRRYDPKLPVIFITAGGTSETAIDAMRRGAFDYLLKPLDLAEVKELVGRAFEVRRLMNAPVSIGDPQDRETEPGRETLVGRSAAMQKVYKAIGRVAPKNVTVLIRGESGTGKELVARALYQYSARAERPFLAVNCAAIPETLLESELFGHEKGAFTGAERRRIGKFEQCDGGTIFLDEIGDMPLALQGKILRVLQDQRFERVGGNETVQTNVRIIAATHRDLEAMAERGEFRWDLYYRLNVYAIELPPLRERMEDLPALVDHFLRRANRELDKDVTHVAPEAMELLQRYNWPGNVRELASVIQQGVLETVGPVLLPDFLPKLLHERPATSAPSHAARGNGSPWNVWNDFVDERMEAGENDIHAQAIALTERRVISRVLQHTGGNQVQAAERLGITRGTLRNKIRQLGIRIESSVTTDDGPGRDEN